MASTTFQQSKMKNNINFNNNNEKYNREAVKISLENCIMEKVSQFFQEVNELVQTKNKTEQTKNDQSQSIQNALQNIGLIEQTSRTLIKTVEKSSKFSTEKKKEMINIIRKVQESCNYITEKKKSFPVKVTQSLNDIISKTQQKIDRINKYMMNFENTSCCSGGKHKIEIEKEMHKLSKIKYFWKKMLFLDAREGYQEKNIHHAPSYDKNQLREQLRQVLEKTVPYEPQPQIIHQHVPVMESKKQDNLRLAHELLLGLARVKDVEESIKIYNQEASNYNTIAQNCLAQFYYEGTILPKNITKAVNYYEKSIQQGDAHAWFCLGNIIQKREVNPDSIQLFNQIQQQPSLILNQSQNTQTSKQTNNSYLKKAILCFEKAAEQNHSDALFEIGLMFDKGIYDDNNNIILEKDQEKALIYYQQSKSLKNPKAINNLGQFYIKNQQLEKTRGDFLRKAIKNFETSSQIGYSRADYNLGMCYERGIGVVKNLDKAQTYFQEAAIKGDVDAKLATIYYLIMRTPNEHTDYEYIRSYNYLLEILNHEEKKEAYYYLGFLYENGLGVTKDYKIAMQKYKKASDLGLVEAKIKMADFLYSGIGVEFQDVNKAFQYYNEASQSGNTEAMINLGSIYEEGYYDFIEQNYQKAFEYYTKAANQGDHKGFLNIGLMYQQGKYVQQDQDEAITYFIKAAQLNNEEAKQILHIRGINYDKEKGKDHSRHYSNYNYDEFNIPDVRGQPSMFNSSSQFYQPKSIINHILDSNLKIKNNKK